MQISKTYISLRTKLENIQRRFSDDCVRKKRVLKCRYACKKFQYYTYCCNKIHTCVGDMNGIFLEDLIYMQTKLFAIKINQNFSIFIT